MIAAFATGFLRNPLILILVVLSSGRLWRGLRTGDVTPKGGTPVTPGQRLKMGICYIGLIGLLVWLMAQSHTIY